VTLNKEIVFGRQHVADSMKWDDQDDGLCSDAAETTGHPWRWSCVKSSI